VSDFTQANEKWRAAKTRANEFAESAPDGGAADVNGAIQAMQRQLADLRMLVRVARTSADAAATVPAPSRALNQSINLKETQT
jgi:hypothetical protein